MSYEELLLIIWLIKPVSLTPEPILQALGVLYHFLELSPQISVLHLHPFR